MAIDRRPTKKKGILNVKQKNSTTTPVVTATRGGRYWSIASPFYLLD
jgi:hypothetical protein